MAKMDHSPPLLSNSFVLLNGIPVKQFKCKRGIRQGDPLSPLLFFLAVELLQIVINKAFQDGFIAAPLPQTHEDFPIIQYADDSLLIMKASAPQLVRMAMVRFRVRYPRALGRAGLGMISHP